MGKKMKRFISLLLSFALVLGLTSGMGHTVYAEGEGHVHGDILFDEWTGTDSLPTEAGNYYLNADVELENTWSVPQGSVNLCLDGHTVSLKEGVENSVISVPTGSVFSLYDTEENSGMITGGYTNIGGGILVEGGNFVMNGGTISGNRITGSTAAGFNCGGGVAVVGGSFEMNDGVISGNIGGLSQGEYQFHKGGGGVAVVGGSFEMNGGEIKENTANNGAAIFAYNGVSVTINGGHIYSNTANASGGAMYGISSAAFYINGGKIYENSANLGGAIWMTYRLGKGGTLHLAGGEIYDNYSSSAKGGVGINSYSSLYLSGSPKVYGNVYGDDKTECNISLNTNDIKIQFDGELSEDASLGIKTEPLPTEDNARVFTSNLAEFGTVDNFHSDIRGYIVKESETGEAQLEVADPISATVTFKVVNGYWDDVEPESSEDITVTINGYEGEELVLDESQIPAVGNSPVDNTYKAGSWDVTPDSTTEITEDVTYTYTYNLKDAPDITVNPEANTLVCNFLEQEIVTAGEAEGGTFKYALGSLNAPEEDYSETIPVTSDAGKYYVWWMVEGDDDHSDIYADEPIVVEMTYRPIIDSSESWDAFAEKLESGNHFNNVTVYLVNDIKTSTMAGSDSHPFMGTFDGHGHTITVEYETDEEYAALFRFANNATIKNLRVTGYIETSAKFAAGFCADTKNLVEIDSCISSVNIYSSVDGDGTHAGFVASNYRTDSWKVIFNNCLFDGSIIGENTTNCAGFLGWSGYSFGYFNNCFNAGTINLKTNDGSATFARVNTETIYHYLFFENSYYVKSTGTVQGTRVTNETPLELCEKLGDGWKTNGLHVVPACFTLPCYVEEIPEANDLDYSGESQKLVTEGVVYCGKILYALGNETEPTEEYSETVPTGTEAGTYYVWYSVIGEEEGNETYDLGPIEVKIAAPISATVKFKVVNGYWDDTDPESADDITVTLNGFEGKPLLLDESQIPAVGNSPVDNTYKAGSWDVTPSTETEITGDTTYTYTYTKKDTATVTKAPVANDLEYDGTAQALVTAGEAVGGEMMYAVGTDETTAPDATAYSKDIPKATEVGTYYVWYMVKGDEDHLDYVADTPVTVAIAPIKIIETIENESDWDKFVLSLSKGITYEGKTVTLANDIAVTTMAGSLTLPFKGTFDGDFHTITVDYTADEDRAAPFRVIDGATIKNLKVTGTISTSAKFAAGIAGSSNGVINLEACYSSVNIVSSVDGDGTHAGLVGIINTGEATFKDCLFDGSISGESTDSCGGFLGWPSFGKATFDNCLNLGEFNTNTDLCGTFARVYDSRNIKINNSYYKNAYGTAQGVKIGDMTALVLREKLGDGWVINGDGVIPKGYPAIPVIITKPTANDLTYNGSAQELVTAGEAEGGEMQYAIGTDATTKPDVSSYSADIATGTEAGTYYVWYMVKGDEYHDDSEAECIEVIIYERISATVTFKVVNGSWDDETNVDKTVTLTGRVGDTLKLKEADIPAVGTKPVDTTYKVGSWDVTPSTETEITVDTTYTYTYAKKDTATVTKAPVANDLEYDGTAQALVTAGEAQGGEMQYALGTDATTAPDATAYSKDIPKATEVGTYYVWYMVKGDDDHLDYLADKPIVVEIEPEVVVIETIENESDWDKFVYSVSKGVTYEGKTVRLTNDITVSAIVGTSTRPFSGIFQGDGHTITFNYTAAGNNSAPFRRVEGAEFYNLKVTGTINTAYKYAAGFVVEALGKTIFDGCWSNISINSTVNGDGTHGGFVSYLTSNENNSVIFSNCLFDGVISGKTTDFCGGFLGFPRDYEIQFINCFYNGETDTLTNNSATFTRVSNPDNITFDNCYYVTPYGLAQGTQTDKTGTELRDQLIGESTDKLWIYSGGMVVPKSFKQAAIVTKEPVANDLIESEDAQELVTAGEAEGGEMQYALGNDAATEPDVTAYSADIPKGTEAGTYYVWYMVKGDEDNYDSEAECIEVTIYERISATVTFKVVNGSWDDETSEDKTVTLTGKKGDKLKLKESDIPAVGTKPVDPTYKLGSWDVTPSTETEITGDTTYTYTYANKESSRVTKAPVAIDELYYNGSAQALVTAGEAEGGEMLYAVGTDETTAPDATAYSKAIPKETEVGTYYVWYMVKGDADHLDYLADKPIVVEIEPEIVVIETIENESDWNKFAYSVRKGVTYEGKTVRLANDITVKTMVGESEHPFSGTFHGDGHTITFNYTATEDTTAPFRYINNATFYNLKITGTIETAYQKAAGFVGDSKGNSIFDVCWSNITINSSVNGDGTHGGFVAILSGGTPVFKDCLFDGFISGATTDNCGGFLGWPRAADAQFRSCLFNGDYDTLTANSATFSRVYDEAKITINNCYYVKPYGLAQGTQTDKTGTELRDQLIGESTGKFWIYSGGMVVPASFKQAAIVTKEPVANKLIESGSAQKLVTAGEAEGGEMQYALGADADTEPDASKYSADIPTGIDNGTYYVWYMVKGNSENYDSEAACIEVTISKIPSATVTFKVVDGAWDDESTEDKTVTLVRTGDEDLKLKESDIPEVGAMPKDETYKPGKWDVTPDTETEITGDTTYTYSYVKKAENEICAGDIYRIGDEIEFGNVDAWLTLDDKDNKIGTIDKKRKLTYVNYTSDYNQHYFKMGNYTTYVYISDEDSEIPWGIEVTGGDGLTEDTAFTFSTIRESIDTIPTASAITVGEKLGDSKLSGGSVKVGDNNQVEGSFEFKDAEIMPSYSDSEKTEYDVVFIPADPDRYETLECKVKLKVKRPADEFHIEDESDWDELIQRVEGGETFANMKVYFDTDISVTTMVGSAEHTFNGTVYGNGHTITFNYSTDKMYAAPFRYVNGARFYDLKVTGSIDTSNKGAAGFVGASKGATVFERCWSDINIKSSVTGDGRHAGFIAVLLGGKPVFKDCLFDGSISGAVTNSCGGFLGMPSSYVVTFTDCLNNGEFSTLTDNCGTFSRVYNSGNIIIDNCYYKTAYGVEQGTQTDKTGTELRDMLNGGQAEGGWIYSGGKVVPIMFKSQASVTKEPASKELTYNGSEQELVKAGEAEGGEMQYALGTDETTMPDASEYTAAIPKAAEVGTYYVWYMVKADDGHEDYVADTPVVSNISEHEDTIIIEDAADWDMFVKKIDGGNTMAGVTVKLANDITVTTMAGSDELSFSGTFDGDFHTITVDYTVDEDRAAPFRWIDGATIKNLKVTGTINTSAKFAAGIVATSKGNTNLEACYSSVNINSSVNGDGTHAGLVGKMNDGKAEFKDCLFDGSISGESTDSCGGLLGWPSGGEVVFKNCLNEGEFSTSANNSGTFTRVYQAEKVTIEDCYYKTAYGAVQGEEIGDMTASELREKLGDGWVVNGNEVVPKGYPAIAVIITEPTANDLTFTGSAQALVTAGEADGGEIQYAIGDDDTTEPTEGWSSELPKATDVGTYYVWFMVKGDDYHDDVAPDCIPVEIKEIDKDTLNEAIEEAEKLLETLEENEDYSEIADELSEKIDEAKEIAEDPYATAEDIKTATEAIKEATEKAEADKLEIDKANFEEAKEKAKADADALAKDDDSDTTKQMIEDAKAAIDAMTYDESKTPEENQAAFDNALKQLEEDIEAQREAEKEAEEEEEARKKAEEEAKKKAKEEADKKAADAVTEKINNLPSANKVTKNDKAAIEEARKAYEALTADQKAKVSQDTLNKLVEAEKALANASKYKNEWIKGQWYDANGSAAYAPKGQWKTNGTGWWFEDSSGWYPASCWQKIDGKWYYFTADGYMDYSEYRDGCWLGADGAWVEKYKGGHWMNDSKGWWYEDESGWYPVNQWLWIDGKCYYFGGDGYMLTNQVIDNYRVGEDGAWIAEE